MSIAVICPFGIDRGLISTAAQLTAEPVRVLVPDSQKVESQQLGATYIHTLPDALCIRDEAAFALWLAEKIRAWSATIVLAPATVQLRNIMAMTAWHLKAGLTADCTALSVEDGVLLQTRPAFGNNIMAQIRTLSPIQLATVRPDIFRACPCPAENAEFYPESFTDDATRVTIEETTPYGSAMPLGQAEIIVAGGLGIGSAEGFAKLSAFAEKIGAAVAASRGAVDAGFAPYRCQVGITGVTVGPKLYIAVGISGAVQHLSGMSGSDRVIAINNDPKAPIFDYADYGIVGDWETVIQNALEELQ